MTPTDKIRSRQVEKVVMVAAQQVIYILTWQPGGNKWVLLPRLEKDA